VFTYRNDRQPTFLLSIFFFQNQVKYFRICFKKRLIQHFFTVRHFWKLNLKNINLLVTETFAFKKCTRAWNWVRKMVCFRPRLDWRFKDCQKCKWSSVETRQSGIRVSIWWSMRYTLAPVARSHRSLKFSFLILIVRKFKQIYVFQFIVYLSSQNKLSLRFLIHHQFPFSNFKFGCPATLLKTCLRPRLHKATTSQKKHTKSRKRPPVVERINAFSD